MPMFVGVFACSMLLRNFSAIQNHGCDIFIGDVFSFTIRREVCWFHT